MKKMELQFMRGMPNLIPNSGKCVWVGDGVGIFELWGRSLPWTCAHIVNRKPLHLQRSTLRFCFVEYFKLEVQPPPHPLTFINDQVVICEPSLLYYALMQYVDVIVYTNIGIC
jgi:hypothetical protein